MLQPIHKLVRKENDARETDDQGEQTRKMFEVQGENKSIEYVQN